VHTNWNRKAASRLLKISYKALLYKIREYGLEEEQRGAGTRLV
jgi:DNA-binding NtrC family response regulator